MAQAVADMLAHFPPESLETGDVLLTNNPWAVSGHRHDIRSRGRLPHHRPLRHPGGCGQRVRLTVDEPAHVSVMAERTRQGASGVGDGEPGRPGRVLLEGQHQPAKVAFGMQPGEELGPELPGGGGFGAT